MTNPTQDIILGHQFNKRLESYALCHPQFLLLLADFKNHYNKSPKKEQLESIHEYYFAE